MPGMRVTDPIKTIVNTKGLCSECVRLLHGSMVISTLMYGRETVTCKEKENLRIKAVQKSNLSESEKD